MDFDEAGISEGVLQSLQTHHSGCVIFFLRARAASELEASVYTNNPAMHVGKQTEIRTGHIPDWASSEPFYYNVTWQTVLRAVLNLPNP